MAFPGCLYLQRQLHQPADTIITQDIDFAPPYSADNSTYQCDRYTLSVPGADDISVSLRTAANMSLRLNAGNDSPDTDFFPRDLALLPENYYEFSARSVANDTGCYCITTTTITAETLPQPFTCTLDESDGVLLQGLQHPVAMPYYLSLYAITPDRNFTVKRATEADINNFPYAAVIDFLSSV